jgi:hypothetical protein
MKRRPILTPPKVPDVSGAFILGNGFVN